MKKIILSIIIILWINLSYADTLADLRNKIRYKIRDTGPQDVYRRTDTELNYWLNEAQREIVNGLKNYDNFVTLEYDITTTTTSAAGYAMPSNFNEMRRVYIINKSSSNRTSYTKLLYTEYAALDKNQTAWDDVDRDEPTHYFLEYTTSSVILHLYPLVDVSHAGTDWLKTYYIPKMYDMSLSTDIPFNGLSYLTPYHGMLADYGVAKCSRNISSLDMLTLIIERIKSDLKIILDRKGKLVPIR